MGLAQEDLLGALDDRLEARATQAVDRDCRGLDREAGFERHVACQVDRVGGGLLGVAEGDVVHVGVLDAGTIERAPRGELAEFRCVKSFSVPPKLPKPVREPDRNSTSVA
jgi:hypothetical protein